MTWDTFDTDPIATYGVTFSGGSLTCQGLHAMSGRVNRSGIAQTVEGKKSGKWYVEITCVQVSPLESPDNYRDGVGVVSSWGMAPEAAAGGFMGGASSTAPNGGYGVGYYSNALNAVNAIFYQDSALSHVNGIVWGTGAVIGMAIDLDNQRLWFTTNGVDWVGTSGTPNPATNTGGFDISVLLGHNCRVYPAVNLIGAGTYTANFGATSFTHAPPSGFTAGWSNTTANTYFGTLASSGYNGAAFPAPSLTPLGSATANDKAVSKWTAPYDATGGAVTIVPGLAATRIKAVIYDATGPAGGPGALLGASTELASGQGEVTLDCGAITFSEGHDYWIGVTMASDGNTAWLHGWGQSANGLIMNLGPYSSPTDPFGSGTYADYRYPMLMSAAPIPPSPGGISQGYIF